MTGCKLVNKYYLNAGNILTISRSLINEMGIVEAETIECSQKTAELVRIEEVPVVKSKMESFKILFKMNRPKNKKNREE